MLTAGALLIFFGVCGIVSALTVAVVGRADRRLARRMQGAARLPLRDLHYLGVLPRWALITGQVIPAPEGVLASPAFGDECVWYLTEVRRDGDDAETGPLITSLSAGGPRIHISDSTGSVQVSVRSVRTATPRPLIRARATNGSKVRGRAALPAESALDRLEQAGLLPRNAFPCFGGRTLFIHEATLAPGVELSVLGRPKRLRSGTVLLRRALVNGSSPQNWGSRVEEEATFALRIAPWMMALGFVVFAIGAAMAWIDTGWPSFGR